MHTKYPEDTFRSYEAMFAERIRNPEFIALVTEDTFDSDETSKTEASIHPGKNYTVPQEGSKVIVGVATWKLEPGSLRRGQYMDMDDEQLSKRPGFDGGKAGTKV